MNEDNNLNGSASSDKQVSMNSPMDSISLKDTNTSEAMKPLKGKALLLTIVAVLIMIGGGAFLFLQSDTNEDPVDSTNQDTSTTEQETDFSVWNAPEKLFEDYDEQGNTLLTLTEANSDEANDEKFGLYSFHENEDDVFKLSRFGSTRDIEAEEGELEQEDAVSVISSIDSELGKESIELVSSTTKKVENEVDHDISQIYLQFTTVDGENTMYYEWMVTIDYTSSVTLVAAASSSDADSQSLSVIYFFNRYTAYLY